jgi:hypothetical protein
MSFSIEGTLHGNGGEAKGKLNGEEITISALRKELIYPSRLHAETRLDPNAMFDQSA